MSKTKSQGREPMWTEDDGGKDDDSNQVESGPPIKKKPRLQVVNKNKNNNSSDEDSSSSMVGRVQDTAFPSFLSSSSSSSNSSSIDGDNAKGNIDPQQSTQYGSRRNAKRSSSPTTTTPHQSRATKKWKLVPVESRASTKKVATQAPASSDKKSPSALFPVRPDGWKTREEMYKIAKQHNRTFLQYMVLRQPASSEQVLDKNFSHIHKGNSNNRNNDDDDEDVAEPRMILPLDLIVQTRFVSKSGNHGGNSYLFLDWKLPGNYLKKRNHHMTIFQDTRPKLFTPVSLDKGEEATHQDPPQQDNADEAIAHPMIFLAPDLPPNEAKMVAHFLQHAPSGTSPREFFQESPELLLLASSNGKIRKKFKAPAEDTTGAEPMTNRNHNTTSRSNAVDSHNNNNVPDGEVALSDTHLENGRFLQYVFRDVSPTRDFGDACARKPAMTSEQPLLTEEALAAHERRWSVPSLAKNDHIQLMLQWSNESVMNTDPGDSRLSAQETLRRRALTADRQLLLHSSSEYSAGPKSMPSKFATLDDFSILKVAKSPNGTSSRQHFDSKIHQSPNHPEVKSVIQRKLDAAFAKVDQVTNAVPEDAFETVQLNQKSAPADRDQPATEDVDNLLPFPDDWNDNPLDAIPTLDNALAMNSAMLPQSSFSHFVSPSTNFKKNLRVKPRKTTRLIGARFCLGLLILGLCPLGSKYLSTDFLKVKVWMQDMFAACNKSNSTSRLRRLDDFISTCLTRRMDDIDVDINAPIPLDACNATEPTPNIPLFLPYHTPSVGALPSTSSAKRTGLFANWSHGSFVCGFIALVFTWFITFWD